MPAYVIANFKITNPEGYKAYVPGVLPTLQAHGAEILVADYESEPLEGDPGSVTVVIKFDSKDAIDAWYNSPEYQQVIRLRTDNSEGMAVSVNEFDLQRNLRILEAL